MNKKHKDAHIIMNLDCVLLCIVTCRSSIFIKCIIANKANHSSKLETSKTPRKRCELLHTAKRVPCIASANKEKTIPLRHIMFIITATDMKRVSFSDFLNIINTSAYKTTMDIRKAMVIDIFNAITNITAALSTPIKSRNKNPKCLPLSMPSINVKHLNAKSRYVTEVAAIRIRFSIVISLHVCFFIRRLRENNYGIAFNLQKPGIDMHSQSHLKGL